MSNTKKNAVLFESASIAPSQLRAAGNKERGVSQLKVLLVIVALLLVAGYIYLDRTQLKHAQLADGTEVYYYYGSSFDVHDDFPETREISIDGELYVQAAEQEQPLIVDSKLLMITVTGKTGFRVIAHRSTNGERVDVLYGKVHTEKNYESPVPKSIDLLDMQLILINSDLDFLEKERLKEDEVPDWIQLIEGR